MKLNENFVQNQETCWRSYLKILIPRCKEMGKRKMEKNMQKDYTCLTNLSMMVKLTSYR